MSRKPRIWCHYDFCHKFEPKSHNGKYCPDCKCKRKQENAVKRLTSEDTRGEELWTLQEQRKLGNAAIAQAKNDWLLERSKIISYDLETSNLDASIGMMLCACVKERGGGTKTFVAKRTKDGKWDDRNIALGVRDEIEKSDYAVGYYSSRFDLPFLNTRLLILGERPVEKIRHIDLYYTARFKLKLHSNKLVVVSETLGGKTDKTRVVGPLWTEALMGDKEAMGYIVDHCEKDVEVLEEMFEELKGFINLSATRWRHYGAGY